MDYDLMVSNIRRGVMSINDARRELGYGDVLLPPALRTDVRCSYCQASVTGDRCRNCGAPR